MNQISAAILVLSSAVFSYSANMAIQKSQNQVSVVLTLVGIALGTWGILSLIGSIIRERELFASNHVRDMVDRFLPRNSESHAAPVRTQSRRVHMDRHLEISPDVRTQLNIAAEMEGRSGSEILEETLRRHLPKYSKSRAA